MQLGNNERVADDHEKTREEKEDDVDQAVVYLRREVWVLDEGSMPTILGTYVSKFLPVSMCSRRQTIIRSWDLFGMCSTREPQLLALQLFQLPWLKWLTNTDKIRLPIFCKSASSSCKRTFFAFCKSSFRKRTFFAVWTLTGTPVSGSQISRVGKVSWHSDQLASNGEYWGVKKIWVWSSVNKGQGLW